MQNRKAEMYVCVCYPDKRPPAALWITTLSPKVRADLTRMLLRSHGPGGQSVDWRGQQMM